MFKFYRSKFYIALILLISVFCIGVFGFRIFGDYSWVDAAYMTIITVTTVGFGEVKPLDTDAKIFTIFLIVSSVFIFAYSISVITEYILSKSSYQNIKYRKMKKSIQNLQNHVIICGYGRNGRQAAIKLKRYRRQFVVIEKSEIVIERHSDDETLFIHGNANEDDVLKNAGVESANCLIAALPDDADNLFIVLSARQLNKNLFIISRASQDTSQRKLILAGANKTIMPDKIGGDHMASLVVVPDLIEFIDRLSIEGENTINLEEVSIDDLPENFTFKSIKDLDLRKITGCTVIGYKEPHGDYVVNPEPDLKLLPNSKLVVLGKPEQIKKLNQIFKLEEITDKNSFS